MAIFEFDQSVPVELEARFLREAGCLMVRHDLGSLKATERTGFCKRPPAVVVGLLQGNSSASYKIISKA